MTNHRHGLLVWLVLLAAFGSNDAVRPANADEAGPIKNNWNDSGLGTEVWAITPDGGYWGTHPVGVPDDPYQYDFKLICQTNGDDFVTACLANAVSRCTEAPHGQPVNWYRTPKIISPPVWEFLSGPTCIYSEKPRDILAEIAASIELEFQKSPVSAATIASQPGPNTLRGAETNLYAEAVEQAFDINLLGQKVHIKATPIGYIWNYGDGVSLGPTPCAGAQLPQDRWGAKTPTGHIYTVTGDFAVSGATHFRGTYSVNGGAPLAIPGQGTFSSAPLPVSVWRSVTKSYADYCHQNPLGVGC